MFDDSRNGMDRSYRRLFAGLIAVLIAGFANQGGSAAAEGRLQDIVVKPNPRLGLSFPGAQIDYYSAISKAGIGVVRLAVSWQHREPRQGHFDWQGFDQRVITLQKLGIEPFLTLESNANWGIRPETRAVTNGTPKNLSLWTKFVTQVVERYDGDGRGDAPGLLRPVRYYQAANEWVYPKNKAGGWLGTTQELIAFVNATYDAVKAEDPKAKFVMGGIATGDLDRIVLHKGVADYDIIVRSGPNAKQVRKPASEFRTPRHAKLLREMFEPVMTQAKYDMADLHFYGPADRDPYRIKAMKDYIGTRGVLSAECGGPSMFYNMSYVPSDHFMAVIERNLLDLSEGVEFCLWFRLGPGPSSSFQNSQVALFDDKKRPKPGYSAYFLLSAILEDMTRVERRKDNAYVIHRKGTSALVVAWADGAESEKVVQVPPKLSGDVLTVTDPVAGRYSIAPIPASRSVRVGRWPVVVGSLPKSLIPSR